MRINPLAARTRWMLSALVAVLALGISACSSSGSSASGYPKRDVQVIVPYPAGSGIDTTTRALADVINKQGKLGKRLQVVNKAGGAGSVGTTAVLNAKPDGYTLAVVPDGPLTLVPHTEKVSYDPKKLTVIDEIINSPIMFVVPKASPYADLKSLVAAAKAKPSSITIAEGPLNYAIPAAKVEQVTGAKFKHVKFDGDQATTTALLGNNVDVGVMQLASALPQLKAGKIRALAITSTDPVDLVPDVPTFSSQGVEFDWQAYNDVIAPDGLPPAVEKKLDAVFSAAIKSPEFAKAAEKLGLIVSGVGPKEAEAHLQDKFDSSAVILKAMGVTPGRGTTTADAATAVTVLVLGLVFGILALREGLGTPAETGAGFFPFIVAVVLVVSAVIVVVQEHRATGRPAVPADEDDQDFQGDVHWWRIVGVLLTSSAVPLVGDTVGLIVTLSVALVAIAKIMGLPGWRNPLILGAAFGAATWLIFVHWLYVPLPAGSLGLV